MGSVGESRMETAAVRIPPPEDCTSLHKRLQAAKLAADDGSGLEGELQWS